MVRITLFLLTFCCGLCLQAAKEEKLATDIILSHIDCPRIIFLHIPKTGGVSMGNLFHSYFSDDDFYPFVNIGWRYESNERFHMNEVFREFPEITQKIVKGHFPFWFFERKDPDFHRSFYFTILRDPIERVLSHQRFHNLKTPFDVKPNLMCKMLSSDLSLQGSKLLKNSKKNILRMNFVMFQDDYENGVRKLCEILGLPQPESIPHVNTTEKHQVDKDTLQKLCKIHRLDIELYQFAKQQQKWNH
jgi:hypothetical protein